MPIDPDLNQQLDNEEVKCVQKWLKDSDADLICDVIKKNKAVKLILARNDLTHEAALKISEAMCTNTSITMLSIAGNQLRDDGVKCFAKMLKENTTVQQVFLSDNFASEQACDELWAANATREKPLTDNLYGLVLDHFSPKRRQREAEIAAEKKASKNKVRLVPGRG